MRVLRFSIGLLVALLVHLAGMRLVPHFSLAVDVFLVVLVTKALDGDVVAAIVAGAVVGLFQDTLGGTLYGMFGVADTIVAYATALLAQKVVIQRMSGVVLAFVAAAATQQALLALLAFVLFPDPELPRVGWVALRIAVTALLGGVVFIASRQWRQRYDSWRRNRTARVHFG